MSQNPFGNGNFSIKIQPYGAQQSISILPSSDSKSFNLRIEQNDGEDVVPNSKEWLRNIPSVYERNAMEWQGSMAPPLFETERDDLPSKECKDVVPSNVNIPDLLAKLKKKEKHRSSKRHSKHRRSSSSSSSSSDESTRHRKHH